MTIDNFGLFRGRLDFKEKTDRYIVHVMCRPKDIPLEKRILGSDEHQRLIRTYYIDSLEYFDKKTEAIRQLCRQNNARAYILPQVRNNFKCLMNMAKKILDIIDNSNFSIKPEHLLREAYASMHKSRAERWILDLDADGMTEYRNQAGLIVEKKWKVEEVLAYVKQNLLECKKNPDDAYIVPTKSGCHIVAPPFDSAKAFKKCELMFEGEKKILTGYKPTGPDEQKPVYKDIHGWLHKDGLSLLFYTDENR